MRSVTLAALVAVGCTRGAKDLPEPRENRAALVHGPDAADKERAFVAPAPMSPQSSEQSKAAGYAGPSAAATGTTASGFQITGLETMAAARKLVRTGQITLVVDDYGKAADEVKRIAEANSGYLAEAQSQRGAHDRRHGTLTIRVAAAGFDAALAAIRALGDVRNENVGTQDVTKAYTDLETRLRVKRETAERLREILRTRTAKLSDVLEAERELARVTEEIEHMEGERRFYDQQVSLSTLTVALQEPAALVESGVFAPLSEALHDSLKVLAASLAAIVYATVFLAPWLLLAWVAWTLFRRARARRKAAAAAPTLKE